MRHAAESETLTYTYRHGFELLKHEIVESHEFQLAFRATRRFRLSVRVAPGLDTDGRTYKGRWPCHTDSAVDTLT